MQPMQEAMVLRRCPLWGMSNLTERPRSTTTCPSECGTCEAPAATWPWQAPTLSPSPLQTSTTTRWILVLRTSLSTTTKVGLFHYSLFTAFFTTHCSFSLSPLFVRSLSPLFVRNLFHHSLFTASFSTHCSQSLSPHTVHFLFDHSLFAVSFTTHFSLSLSLHNVLSLSPLIARGLFHHTLFIFSSFFFTTLCSRSLSPLIVHSLFCHSLFTISFTTHCSWSLSPLIVLGLFHHSLFAVSFTIHWSQSQTLLWQTLMVTLTLPWQTLTETQTLP